MTKGVDVEVTDPGITALHEAWRTAIRDGDIESAMPLISELRRMIDDRLAAL